VSRAGLRGAAGNLGRVAVGSAPAASLGLAGLGAIPGAIVGGYASPYVSSLVSHIPGIGAEGGMSPDDARKAVGLGLQRVGSWMGFARDPFDEQREVDILKFHRLGQTNPDKWTPTRVEYAIKIYDAGGANTPEGKTLLADLKKQLDAEGEPPEVTETITTDPVTSQAAADVATQVAEDAVVDETVQPEPVPEEQNAYIVKLDPLVGRTTRVKVYIEQGMSAEDVKREAKKKFARSKYKELMAAHPGLTKRDIRKIRKAYMKAANKMEDVTQVGVGPGEDLGMPLQETIHRLISEIRQEQRK
jgi:hypothetical protein